MKRIRKLFWATQLIWVASRLHVDARRQSSKEQEHYFSAHHRQEATSFTSEISQEEPSCSSKITPASNVQPLAWKEHFVVEEAAQATDSMAESMSRSFSYLEFPNFANNSETLSLVQAALDFHRQQQSNSINETTIGRTDTSSYIDAAVQNVNASCLRFSVDTYLSNEAQTVSQRLVFRLWDALKQDPQLHHFAKLQMKSEFDRFLTTSNQDLWDPAKKNMEWYTEQDQLGNRVREPCVNLYFPPSDAFEKHHDGLSMTFLMLLTDLQDYQGGGTKLYGPDPERQEHVKVRPPAGTLLLWATDMMHEALPITQGIRSVCVGSFQMIPEGEMGEYPVVTEKI